MLSEYERKKQETIKKNKELLASLGLDKPLFEPKARPAATKTKETKKRKNSPQSEQSDSESPAPKIFGLSSASEDGPRRSSRHAGKVMDYGKEHQVKLPRSAALISGIKTRANGGPQGEGGKRIHNPKTYGQIPGIEAETWWETRRECSEDAIHAPWVGGISPGPQGAYSVALSGGYEDDVDLGYAFTYTGSGGRDLKGTKNNPKNLRTAPQSSDQTFEKNFNKALLRSSETKKPVRVIRGFNVRSKYAPYEGYRYDGLYRVEKAWEEKGNNPKGYIVCKFAFKRLPGQPPLPVREDWHEDNNEDLEAEDEAEDLEAEDIEAEDIEAEDLEAEA